MTASLTPPVAAPHASAKDDAGKAAKMLEAYFLRRIMAEVRKSGEGGLLAPGFGGEVFREMLDEALADRMAEGGGIGIAALVEKHLAGGTGAGSLAALTPPGSTRAVRAAYGAAGSIETSNATWRHPLGPAMELEPGKTWTMPVEANRISSGFGKVRFDPTTPTHTRTHKGIDMTAPAGTPVHAARGGEVVRAGTSIGGFGNLVVIDHGGGIRSFYGHLQSVGVKKGDRVEVGSPIGAVGSTGRSTGPHLHFEVRRDGKSIDPTTDIQGLKARERTDRSIPAVEPPGWQGAARTGAEFTRRK
ncbi:MAG TPA: peptidoglycan DD-metalloendopeptidase family protein [Candidatus Acidoferrum sp.]|nr:peptidoglycan DD-metalloendopeptidase family protein [Candidatus Acidoferrum sp.]